MRIGVTERLLLSEKLVDQKLAEMRRKQNVRRRSRKFTDAVAKATDGLWGGTMRMLTDDPHCAALATQSRVKPVIDDYVGLPILGSLLKASSI
jgi:hypothetical protein